MTDRRLGELADLIDGADIPPPPALAHIRRRARRRTARRQAVAGMAVVAVLVAAVAGAGTLGRDDPELSTAALPGTAIERFDAVPDGIGTWEFRSSPSIVTRTGAQSGFGLRRVTGADGLLVYLADTGICVDAESCADAPDSFSGSDLEAEFVETDGGPARALIGAGAPFARWNVVVVPGITGDLHAGSNANVDVPGGPAGQHFVGADNLAAALADVFDADDVGHDRVVVAGSGVAGLGALLTLDGVADIAGASLVGVIADGGAIPRLGTQVPVCVVQRWGTLFDVAYPADWGDLVAGDEAPNLSQIYEYAAKRYPDIAFVEVTTRDDPAMRGLLRAGADGCAEPVLEIRPEAFGRGIDALESHLAEQPGWTSVVVDRAGESPIASVDTLDDLGDLASTLRTLAEGSPS